MIKKLVKLKYAILFFIIAQIIVISILVITKNNSKELFLENKTNLVKTEYQVVYSKVKEQSKMIFYALVNNKKIINLFKDAYKADANIQSLKREEIYNSLLPSYKYYKKLVGLKQLHFHFVNNKSFLRMHQPTQFGDNLSEVRESVVYINKHHKAIDTFEFGVYYAGFRFLYPLFDDNNSYIGSVEVSMSAKSFQNILSDNIRFSHFIFSKKEIDEKGKDGLSKLYKTSYISPLFTVEIENINNKYKKSNKIVHDLIDNDIKKDFSKSIVSKEITSFAIDSEEDTSVLTFLPIENNIKKEVIAYLVVIAKSDYLHKLYFDNKVMIVISLILFISLFTLLYKHDSYQNTLLKHELKCLDDKKNVEKLLLEQSKQAQMGSMLSNIAHQWKQPLARINSKLIEMPLDLNLTNTQEVKLTKDIADIEDYTLYMANTIENFRTYFHPNKFKQYFNINKVIQKAIALTDISSTLRINIEFIENDKTMLHSYEDELLQVLIILLVNSKEAFSENKTEKSFINIKVINNTDTVSITVIDNAGGIEYKIASTMFNPYFTTKKAENSGIGLYMAKMIIEGSMSGKLEYQKDENISKFTIQLPNI